MFVKSILLPLLASSPLAMAAPVDVVETNVEDPTMSWSHPSNPGELCGNMFIFRPCTEGYVCTSWYDRPGHCAAIKNKGSTTIRRDDVDWFVGVAGDRCGGSRHNGDQVVSKTICGPGLVCFENRFFEDLPGVCIKEDAAHPN